MPRHKLSWTAVAVATVAVSLLLVLNAWGNHNSTKHTVPPARVRVNRTDLMQAGDSLIDMHEQAKGGWRFKSAIQAPHYQTDRDVGSASEGMGFLVLADQFPQDPKWLQAAEQTAGWLQTVAQKDSAGHLYWNDFVDDRGSSGATYTSFDDGTLGIGDFFWQLYERTHNEQYRQVAESSLAWTFAQAENISENDQPVYRWRWDVSDRSSGYQMGMGMGAVGTVQALAQYYERFQNLNPVLAAECKQYIDGSLRYINQVRNVLGRNKGDHRALPETGEVGQDGDTNMNSGYLSGSAGAAFMYVKLYKVFGDMQYLHQAEQIFSWLEDSRKGPLVKVDNDKIAWKLALDPKGGNDNRLATGFEEGTAGIGWVYIQAYKVTGNPHYLTVAKQAGNWLTSVADRTPQGVAWHEDESPRNPIIHANLNNGSAGIGFFLKDLGGASHDPKYDQMAMQAYSWLLASAKHDNENIYWVDNDGKSNYSHDPSWHWGAAGIINFMSRMNNGKVDMPGEQSGI
jgi:hypothetical protein